MAVAAIARAAFSGRHSRPHGSTRWYAVARRANAQPQRRWTPPGKEEFARVDPDAKEKGVERSSSRPSEALPGRRPNGGRDIIDRRGMSQSMQKRIARARAEGERIERNRSAEREALLQRQISDMGKQLHGLTVGQKVSAEEAAHEQKMAELEGLLEKAHTDGNHAEIARITREMQEKSTAWETRKRELLATPVQASTVRKEQPTGPTPEGRAWIAANADWYGRPGFEAETAATIAIDDRLIAEGSNPNSPEHYKKIRKELRKRFREIEVVSPYDEDNERDRGSRDDDERGERRGRERDDDDEDDDEDDEDDDTRDQDADDEDDERDDDQDDDDDDDDAEERGRQRQRRQPAFMNMEDGGSTRNRKVGLKVRDGKIILSRKDRENMIRFGHDPDNDQHVQNYARTKREISQDDEG